MRSLHSQQEGLDDSDDEDLSPGTGWPGPWVRRQSRQGLFRGRGGCAVGDRGPCGKSGLRLARLAVVCLLCPALLLGWPLYMRYFVLRDLAVPLAPSDVRLLDLQVSTTWCQAQEIRANGTFIAWMLGGQPQRGRRQKVSMTRDIRLGDDMKEYWGFYLLEGSSVTVSPCARWPGASLVVIRGYDHLLQCAYIGDDSSEEAEEVRRNALRKQLEEGRRLRPSAPPGASSPAAPPEDAAGAPLPPPPPPRSNGSKLRSNQPHRMHVVKEAVELHEKTRPAPRLFNKQDGIDEDGEEWSSAEVARGMLERLRALGVTGQRALDRMRTVRLGRDLARQDEQEENTAAEVEAEAPQPHAPAPGEDVRGWVNETTSLDESHSELWSSFSSSEEALLACAGLVLNLPLTPHRHCHRRRSPEELDEASAANVITYRIPADGHYFFVLGSENEVQTNFVRVRFDLDKVVYDITNPVAECGGNASGQGQGQGQGQGYCALPLRFMSDDTLVLEVPVSPHQDQVHANVQDHVLAVSTCQPRTALFVGCVLALPVIILTCAF